MLEGKRVAVVVPAYDEEELIGETLAAIPDFVDRVYVVDDHSRDGTAARAQEVGDSRVEVIVHDRNEGVGAAIVSGYRRAVAECLWRSSAGASSAPSPGGPPRPGRRAPGASWRDGARTPTPPRRSRARTSRGRA